MPGDGAEVGGPGVRRKRLRSGRGGNGWLPKEGAVDFVRAMMQEGVGGWGKAPCVGSGRPRSCLPRGVPAGVRSGLIDGSRRSPAEGDGHAGGSAPFAARSAAREEEKRHRCAGALSPPALLRALRTAPHPDVYVRAAPAARFRRSPPGHPVFHPRRSRAPPAHDSHRHPVIGVGMQAALDLMRPVDSASSLTSLYTGVWDGRFANSLPPQSGPDGAARRAPELVVFSGGTAFNSVAGKLQQLTTRVTHVLPVSDDGGSTSEIVRVLGGPAVGDIRSRCLRLADDSDEETRAVRRLLGHRLPSDSHSLAKQEWHEVVEGEHPLWEGVSEPYKHTIRAFLVYFQSQILRHATQRFNFKHGSIGNFFFAGARLFFRSLEAAIFLFSRVARIPEGSLVLPAIETEERITLGAELEDGAFLRGQSVISHPPTTASSGPEMVDKIEDGPTLPSPISRVFYLSSEGTNREHEVYPAPNRRVVAELGRCSAIIYGMGSVYTSICPSLILDGVGEIVASRDVPKVLLLNGRHDRETSSCQAHKGPMTCADVAMAIVDALNRRHSKDSRSLSNLPCQYITTVLVPQGGTIPVDKSALRDLGIEAVHEVPSIRGDHGQALFEPEALVRALAMVVSDTAANAS
eukprot:evm.model.scf_2215.2 EVM.evm.TU.scf_2215.2   scf_2215:6275-11096(+)